MHIDEDSLAPKLQWHTEEFYWKLLRKITATHEGGTLTVPAGFKTDLASIPRAVRSVTPQVGKHIVAAIFHDYLYSGVKDWDRKQCDEFFLAAMKFCGVSWIRRNVMYRSVRMFGNSSFISPGGGGGGAIEGWREL